MEQTKCFVKMEMLFGQKLCFVSKLGISCVFNLRPGSGRWCCWCSLSALPCAFWLTSELVLYCQCDIGVFPLQVWRCWTNPNGKEELCRLKQPRRVSCTGKEMFTSPWKSSDLTMTILSVKYQKIWVLLILMCSEFVVFVSQTGSGAAGGGGAAPPATCSWGQETEAAGLPEQSRRGQLHHESRSPRDRSTRTQGRVIYCFCCQKNNLKNDIIT